MKISLMMPVKNQADEARLTVRNALDVLEGTDHEVIVVDDDSTDGCCHDMPSNVLVHRTRGATQSSNTARRIGGKLATGDVLIWSDPHCRYPTGSLPALAKTAMDTGQLVMAASLPWPKKRVVYGTCYGLCDRGLASVRCWNPKSRKTPVLYGTVYAVRKDVYKKLGGWPKLPGVWGCAELSLSLLGWFAGVDVLCRDDIVCTHKARKSYTPDGGLFSYHVDRSDTAGNAHFMHGAFFPSTYEAFWKPILAKTWGKRSKFWKANDSAEFKHLRRQIEKTRKRSEAGFYKQVLDMEVPTNVIGTA